MTTVLEERRRMAIRSAESTAGQTMGSIQIWMRKIHTWARGNGFYSPPLSEYEACMLVVSEISEAIEELQSGRTPQEWYWSNEPGEEMKPEGYPVELADAVIRLFDRAEFLGLDLEFFIALKMAYNETRPRKNGKLK